MYFYGESNFDSSVVYASSRTAACVVVGLVLGVVSLYAGTCVVRGQIGNIEPASWATALLASLCFLIAVCIYAANMPKLSGFHLGYSFALVCVGQVFTFFSGLLFCPTRKQTQLQAWV